MLNAIGRACSPNAKPSSGTRIERNMIGSPFRAGDVILCQEKEAFCVPDGSGKWFSAPCARTGRQEARGARHNRPGKCAESGHHLLSLAFRAEMSARNAKQKRQDSSGTQVATTIPKEDDPRASHSPSQR